MSRFLLTPLARRDLAGIWSYSAERWNEEQADRYVREIADACSALAAGRRRGRSAAHVREDYQKYPSGSHMIYFRKIDGGTIEIVRILHQRMDVETHLR